MPSLNEEFLFKLKDDYKLYDCFIETGTHKGETIFCLEKYFKKLYTIEISEMYYNNTKNLYNGDKIDFLLGDSSYVLKELLTKVKDNCIFFLDGHWSCGDTGRGEKDCPLIEEVTHINNLFKNDAIIIIDDYRLFGLSHKTNYPVNWGDINKDAIISILNSRITNIYHLDSDASENDRLIIHIKKIDS
jgi:hypothetical protein